MEHLRKSKEVYGLHYADYYDSNDPRFLQEAETSRGEKLFILSGESEAATVYREQAIGSGYVLTEVQQLDGWYAEMAIHFSQLK